MPRIRNIDDALVPVYEFLEVPKVTPGKYDAEDMPKYPSAVLYRHIAFKGAQVGAVAGVLLAPAWNAYRQRGAFSASTRRGIVGLTSLGLVAATGLAMQRFQTIDADGFEDRAFRLSHNQGQLKMDAYATYGMVTCGLLGAVGFGHLLGGMSLGIALGIGAFALEVKGGVDVPGITATAWAHLPMGIQKLGDKAVETVKGILDDGKDRA